MKQFKEFKLPPGVIVNGTNLSVDYLGIRRTMDSWRMANYRCSDPRAINYTDYGGRGITVCDRWLIADNFIEDMGIRPEGMTLDRIDVNGNYEPGNCRWATRSEQQRNRRNSRKIEHKGREKHLFEWADETGISRSTILRRMKHGQSKDLALSPEKFLKQKSYKHDYSHLVGSKFGYLTVKEIIETELNDGTAYNRRYRAICECVCGNRKEYDLNNIRSGRTTSCSCQGKGVKKIEGVKEGDTFGEWTVIRANSGSRGKRCDGRICTCECSCGVIKDVNIYTLVHGQSSNCGHNFVKHSSSQKKDPLFKYYKSWSSMKEACYNPNNKSYKNIGAKGIKVADSWVNDFRQFMSDMGEKPKGTILCRRDVTKDYSPSNCFWGSRSQSFKLSNQTRSKWPRE